MALAQFLNGDYCCIKTKSTYFTQSLSVLFLGKHSECHSCDASCKTCFGPQALDCASCFKGTNISPFFHGDYLKNSQFLLADLFACIFVPQDFSWTRTVLVLASVHPAHMQTRPLTCVRIVHQTVNHAQTTVTTASAAPKAANNFFSTRGGVGQIAQSKELDKLNSRMTQKKTFAAPLYMF